MNKKRILIILIIVGLPLLSLSLFEVLWQHDAWDLFPFESVTDGYVDQTVTGHGIRYEDLTIWVSSVNLEKTEPWSSTCVLEIVVEKGSNSYQSVTARAGDEIEVDGYQIRVIRVFPFSPSTYSNNYHRGRVTLEIIDE